MKKASLLIIVISTLLLSLFIWGQVDFEKYQANCEKKLTNLPSSYLKGSELYYLAWIEHGKYGEKEESARRFFELKNKKEIETAEKLCLCEKSQVTKNFLILSLFELKPDKYLKQTKALLYEKDSSGLQPDLEATWTKGGSFEGQEVDFYFDWGAESALKLIEKGHLSERGLELLFERANSFYPEHREKAQMVFNLFEGLPPIDLSKQRERYDGENPFKEQFQIIEKWFEKNKSKIYWNSAKQTYFVRK